MDISGAAINHYIATYAWPFARIGAFVMIMPLFGTKYVPARIRMVFAVLLTMIIAPLVTSTPTVELVSPYGVMILASQLIIGFIMGFVFLIVFQGFVIAGQLIATQSGLGFASLMDPTMGAQVPVISQFYLMLISLIFLAMNGHLLLIQALADSFKTLPIGLSGLSKDMIWDILKFSHFMFDAAIWLALPAIVALLIVNIAFAVMTRAAPQLNIFSIGFPITLTFGLFVIYFSIQHALPNMQLILVEGFNMLDDIAKA